MDETLQPKTALASRILRVVAAGCVLTLACVAGCDKPAGPKRTDHQAAHAARYHPDVKRDAVAGSPTPELAATNSAATTRPAGPFAGLGPVGSPVLFVNDDSITVQEILEPLLENLKEHARTLTPPDYRDYLWRRVGEQTRSHVSALLVYQKAKNTYHEEAHKAFDEEADRLVKETITQRFAGVRARYEAHLKSLNLTEKDVKERIKREIMFRQFLRETIVPKVKEPSRRELLKYYQSHIDEFTTPAKAELFLIEVPIATVLGKPINQATAEQIEAAREHARTQMERAHEELVSGVDFAAVAKRYSEGIHKDNGGAWGEITSGSLTGRWAEPARVLFSLEQGQVSDVTVSDESVFMVKCGQRTREHRLPFEEAQARIVNQLKDEEFDRMSIEYVAQLGARATMSEEQQVGFLRAVVAAAPLAAGPAVARENRAGPGP